MIRTACVSSFHMPQIRNFLSSLHYAVASDLNSGREFYELNSQAIENTRLQSHGGSRHVSRRKCLLVQIICSKSFLCEAPELALHGAVKLH